MEIAYDKTSEQAAADEAHTLSQIGSDQLHMPTGEPIDAYQGQDGLGTIHVDGLPDPFAPPSTTAASPCDV